MALYRSFQLKAKTSVGSGQQRRIGRPIGRQNGGQIIVEYILLLVIAVIVAALIISSMVSRNPESPGFLVQKWQQLLEFVGSDTADDIKRDDGTGAAEQGQPTGQ